MKPAIKIILLITLLVTSVKSPGQVSGKMEEMLKLVAEYQCNSSREWQQDFQGLMKEVYNDPENRQETEKMMVDFLRSDASTAGKQLICKELGIIGTDYSVPVLSEMLSDPELSGMSLLALEKIPGEMAGKALRDALSQAPAEIKTAIINSLGVRKDEQAILQLEKFIHDTDKDVASAAIAALGNIESALGAGILKEFFDKAPDALRWETANSLIKCANSLLQRNENSLASDIYDQVYDADPPMTLKYAALKGQFLISEEDPFTLISIYLQNEDPAMHRQIINLIYKVPNAEGFGQLFSELPDIPQTSKLYLLNTLADMQDYSVRPVLMELIHDDNPFIRITAIKAIPDVGQASDARLLASIAAEKRGKERDAIRESLAILAAENTNDSIMSAIRSTGGNVKAELIRSSGERNMVDAVGLLISAASDSDRNVRTESIRALGKIANTDLIPDMIEILINSRSRRERLEAERALFSLTQKFPTGSDCSGEIIDALNAEPGEDAMISLIGILGQIGDNKDLPVLREYLKPENDDIRIAVIKAFTDWPDASPMEDLKEIVRSTDDQIEHTLSLRGWMEVIKSDHSMSSGDKLAEVDSAWNLAQNTGERKIVISGLSHIHTTDALEMAFRLTDEEDVKREAEAAVLDIADDTSWGYPEKTREILKVFLTKTNNEDYKLWANRILERM